MNPVPVIVALVFAATPAAAQPLSRLVDPPAPVDESYEEPTPLRRHYLIPAGEILFGNIALNIAAQAAGMDWAQISLDSMERNLTRAWSYDEDPFTINQLGHPYGGALAFTAPRSAGLGFWVSASYAFFGSLFWEVFMETEVPSVNDQFTTPVGGSFLGEVMHRWGHSLRSGGDSGRRALAAVIDPMGELNPRLIGQTWRETPPPHLYAQLAVGANAQIGQDDDAPFHLGLSVQHGLPSDLRFKPKRPFDHFVLDFSMQASTKDLRGSLDLRGLLAGRAIGDERRRALWGLFGGYDYLDPAGPRASVVGFGPGITSHVALGDRGFVTATAVASVVPWGAAGGHGDGEGPQRDYHHGPGATGLVELAVGRRGLGSVKLGARALQIYGGLVGDATETVVVTTATGMLGLGRHHAIGVEGTYGARSADFEGAAMDPVEDSQQVRVFYTLTSDHGFGGVGD